jgi:RNA polymerase sigma-70 factor (ECF subfamily)
MLENLSSQSTTLETLTEKELRNVKRIAIPDSNVSDTDIIKRIKAGDVDAYGSIMRRYNQRIYRIARSFVTDDAAAMNIVQEAHIKAYMKIDSFRGPTGFFAWLASITRNEALMYLRKHKREVTMEENELDFMQQENNEFFTDDKLPDALIENKQLQSLINKNIDKLPENFRTVFVLRSVEQLSVKETAQILDIKEETVKTRLFRAKRLLRDQIQTYLNSVGMSVYEFGGDHCNVIVHNVLHQIKTQ